MKRLIICPAGEWAKKLLTISRYNEVDYFIDKPLYPIEYLRKEKKSDIIIVISDSKKYQHYADVLSAMGFEENTHFFNGWKLHTNFYRDYIYSLNWQEFEENSAGIMKTER